MIAIPAAGLRVALGLLLAAAEPLLFHWYVRLSPSAVLRGFRMWLLFVLLAPAALRRRFRRRRPHWVEAAGEP